MAGDGEEKRRLTAGAEHAGRRLDNLLLSLTALPRPAVYRLIRLGAVRVNRKKTGPDYRLEAEDEISVPANVVQPAGGAADHARQSLPAHRLAQLSARLPEIGRGKDYLVVNKPAGLAVQGGTGIGDSVASVMGELFPDMAALKLVHRLDKGTSGCLALAASLAFARSFQQQLRKGAVRKEYLCLVHGRWNRKMRLLEGPLPSVSALDVHRRARGKHARTEVEVVQRAADYSLLLARPETGRTHQLRIQFSDCGHPLVGDRRYGPAQQQRQRNDRTEGAAARRMCLHAVSIQFADLAGGEKRYRAALPRDMAAIFHRLGIDSDRFCD